MAGETYLSAGVDLQAAEALKERIRAFCGATYPAGVPGAGRGFAGAYPLRGYKAPVMVASVDGVGTKLKIASLVGHWDALGQDLVNLNANDVLTKGARPLFFLDYISMGTLDAQAIEAMVRGMAWACLQMGCAFIGGETAQMPGLYQGEDFDLAGFLVGAVEQEALLDGSDIAEGDALVGIPSSGLHTNGFSLVRRVFRVDQDPTALYKRYDGLNHSLGEELLIPHRCYWPLLEPVLPLLKGIAHVTGGGLPAKVPLVLPQGLAARFHRGAWEVPPIFGVIQREGRVQEDEMYRVFNMGLGMVLACAPEQVAPLTAALPQARLVGEVVPQTGPERVSLGT